MSKPAGRELAWRLGRGVATAVAIFDALRDPKRGGISNGMLFANCSLARSTIPTSSIMPNTRLVPSLMFLTIAALGGCDTTEAYDPAELPQTKVLGPDGKADASAVAVFMDFEFDGELVSDFSFNPAGIVEDQLLYTIGDLNGFDSVGRLDRLQLSNVQTESLGDGRTRITYHAVLPVAWGQRDDVPTTYDLQLPIDMSSAGLQHFADSYADTCVDFSQAHDVDPGNMWYYYRPEAFPCEIAPEDLFVATATLSPSESQTTGTFPEYDKVWEDDTLQVLAVFGKNEDGATSNSDAGIFAYNRFLRSVEQELAGGELTTIPVDLPSNPGIEADDVQFDAELPDGRRVQINALLVDNVRTAPQSFTQRYGELSTRADFIAYNGHAGLGANIRALAQKGEWTQGQYSIVFMNGCDTYAYVDSALFDARAAINPDDPNGTRHLDIVTNAMPAFFSQVSQGTMAMVRGLLRRDDPMTYEQMFAAIDSRQVVLVSGEEDNTFVPGGGGDPEEWEGMQHSGTVARNEESHFETPTLAAGWIRSTAR